MTSPQSSVSSTLPCSSDGPPPYESILPAKTDTFNHPSYFDKKPLTYPTNSEKDSQPSVYPTKTEDTFNPSSYLDKKPLSYPENPDNDSQLFPSAQPNDQTPSTSYSQPEYVDSSTSRNTNETSNIASAPPVFNIYDPVPIAAYQPESYDLNTGTLLFFLSIYD